MRRLVYLLPVLFFVVLAGYFAVSLTRDPQRLPSALINHPAPSFALPGLGERPGLSTADLKGRVSLVNFFASWCVPCRVEHPMLIQLSKDKGVALVGIAYKDKPADAERLLQQAGDPYARIGLDQDGRVAIDFGVYGVPETYVVDKSGTIRFRQVGPISAEDYRERILPLLQELERS